MRKTIILVLIILLGICSCKTELSKEDQEKIIQNTEELNSFCDLVEIAPIGKEQDGEIFSSQKFILRLKVKRNCFSNASQDLSVTTLRFVDPQKRSYLETKSDLIFKEYKPNDTLSVFGYLFSLRKKSEFDKVRVPTVFYMLGQTSAAEEITQKDVCSEANRYFEVGRRFLGIMGTNIPITRQLIKPVDEACIILHGYNASSVAAIDDYSSGKIAGEDLVNLLLGRSMLINPYFGEQAIRCPK